MPKYVNRAHFYAAIHRNVFVELPAEDKMAKKGEFGRLNVSFHGIRDAAKDGGSSRTGRLGRNVRLGQPESRLNLSLR